MFFLVAIMLSACEFYTEENVVTHQETYVPKFRTTESDFKKEVLRLIPAESVHLESSVTQENGEMEMHYLTVKVLNPEEYSSPMLFLSQAGEVKEKALESIENIEQYEKLFVAFEEKTMRNGLESTRTQKREISLN